MRLIAGAVLVHAGCLLYAAYSLAGHNPFLVIVGAVVGLIGVILMLAEFGRRSPPAGPVLPE